jgi:hypothetical protein
MPRTQDLEHAVHTIAERSSKADERLDYVIEVGFGTPRFVHRVTEV